jgi:hypothetical protein
MPRNVESRLARIEAAADRQSGAAITMIDHYHGESEADALAHFERSGGRVSGLVILRTRYCERPTA